VCVELVIFFLKSANISFVLLSVVLGYYQVYSATRAGASKTVG